jgi:dTDP-4-dehydrorhamnose 3,5-epimerase
MELLSDIQSYRLKEFADNRGSFTKIFESICANDDSEFIVKQVNLSRNTKSGTLRGLHFQTGEFMEDKIVICLEGSISDVIVDVRENSPTFLQHRIFQLSAADNNALRVPQGFAHGFQTVVDQTAVLYLHSKNYSQSNEAGLNALDPLLGVLWPLPVSCISERDANFHFLARE